MNTLTYCLNVLKIKEDSKIHRDVFELQKNQIESENEWLSAMNTIAHVLPSSYTFSQSQISDFLTLSAKGIEGKRSSQIVLEMYRDIIENYESFPDSLKSNYPKIIVDVISVINQGIDTRGTKVNVIGLDKYYQSRKELGTTTTTEEEKKTQTSIPKIAASAIHKEKITLSNNKDVVEILAQITNREIKEIEESIARLQNSDLNRISQLCGNYDKLAYYSKLITKEEEDQFKKEIQKEFGRTLKPYQITRAANSIKRVQTYVENILDNKFIADVSHGINHIKHNLEYGYQLMNLIERKRRSTTTR